MFNQKINYFKNVSTIEELKKEYRILTKKYHPDLNQAQDTTKIMQEINSEYDYLLTCLPKTKKDNTNYTQAEAHADKFKDIINNIIHLDITIEIIGSWVWVSGDTKPYRKILKENGFWWAGKKLMWYWRAEEDKQTRRGKALSIDQIRNKYGSIKLENKKQYQIA